MHRAEVRTRALSLVEAGLNDCQISREIEVARTTVRDWRRGPNPEQCGTHCPRCWMPSRRSISFSHADYAQVLGLYLGDGDISRGRRTERMRISLDPRYPLIIADTRTLLARCFSSNRVGLVEAPTTRVVSVYSSHLSCLFPQHGPGKKHQRPIVLETWQQEHLDLAPWAFLRGCIWSDGCSFVNRTGPYSYLTYDFCNLSADIRGLFTHACDLVGVRFRHTGHRVRMNRRDSVALMADHIGLKN